MVDKLLELAGEEAVKGSTNKDGGPFGAVIADENGNIISSSHNMVIKTKDPTAHAEIVAIRDACKRLNTYDLSGYIMYSSCCPCPMCLSAIIWSNIKTIYYAATPLDAEKSGFRDKDIYDYIKGENKLINCTNIYNKTCVDALHNYKGDVY